MQNPEKYNWALKEATRFAIWVLKFILVSFFRLRDAQWVKLKLSLLPHLKSAKCTSDLKSASFFKPLKVSAPFLNPLRT